jgi:hypothetical protein
MAEKEFGDLLKRMGEIAKAVNAFTSEAVQGEAFATLVSALNDQHDDGGPGRATDVGNPSAPPATKVAGAAAKVRNGKRENSGASKATKIDRDLDLHPSGKQSFADFIAEKQPSSNQDKFAVIVYYLEQILEHPRVSVSQIHTVFRLTSGWREPTDLEGALRVAATRKATIDTADLENITTTAQGRNFVQHDLPPKSGRKK